MSAILLLPVVLFSKAKSMVRVRTQSKLKNNKWRNLLVTFFKNFFLECHDIISTAFGLKSDHNKKKKKTRNIMRLME